jgi:acetylornithine deacetylase/succinyl-diaminopimelate desuccinylase-like protein
VESTAEAVAATLTKAGCETVEVCETEGYPIVYGEILKDPALPTVLVYGHYDVQPPDPLELWTTPPFEPVIKPTPVHPDGAIFARGASDDKGQMFMHIKALEYMVAHDALPCNVKFMIEGEEEVGSSSIETYVKEHKEKLANDIILVSDTGMIAPGVPSITSGLRGLSYVEVTVTGPNRDVHSGLYGGAVANPINILCEMIASLHDAQNRVTIPGFYEQVQELTSEERGAMAKAPFDLEEYKAAIGIEDVSGEAGYTTLERHSIRPTLDVNGIWGGYTGQGAKTVIPSQAHAKISMRLVPDQDWKSITVLFRDYFLKLAPPGVKVTVTTHHGGYPFVTPMDHIGYKAASKALEKTFGISPIPQRGGGSIPIISLFEKELGSKTILMGFGLDTDALHSPNEHFGVDNFLKGIETIPYFYKYFTELAG